jgi:uncharacterized protein YuzE
MMKIEYDAEVDIMYIELRGTPIEESDEVSPGVIVDYDENGVPVGIEILDASDLLGTIPDKVELAVAARSKS